MALARSHSPVQLTETIMLPVGEFPPSKQLEHLASQASGVTATNNSAGHRTASCIYSFNYIVYLCVWDGDWAKACLCRAEDNL